MPVADTDDVRLVSDFVPRQQPGAADEGHQEVVGDRADRFAQGLRSHLRREPHVTRTPDRDARAPVDVDEMQHVTRIDEMRVLDHRVDVPDFGPIPGVAQEHRGDVPQRVAALDDIGVRRIGRERHGHRLPGSGLLGPDRRCGTQCEPQAGAGHCQGGGAEAVAPGGRLMWGRGVGDDASLYSVGCQGRDRRLIIRACAGLLPTGSQSRPPTGWRRNPGGFGGL